ncbi:MAG: carboxyl transferase domain-containing protein [Burkholderiaceae bacterium]
MLAYKVEGFIEGRRIFCNLAGSCGRLPVIAVVHGSSTAGGAYMPELSDHVIMVRSRAGLSGRPTAAESRHRQVATDEELGGALMHCRISGLGEYLAGSGAHGLAIARELVEETTLDAPGSVMRQRLRLPWTIHSRPVTRPTNWPA